MLKVRAVLVISRQCIIPNDYEKAWQNEVLSVQIRGDRNYFTIK